MLYCVLVLVLVDQRCALEDIIENRLFLQRVLLLLMIILAAIIGAFIAYWACLASYFVMLLYIYMAIRGFV